MEKHFYHNSKFLLFFLLILPMIGLGQKRNLVFTSRFFPKIDKVTAFEKALAVHAQKYHKGDSHWSVYQIQSGPDVNGYQVTEGPTSWEATGVRGDLGADHVLDFENNVAIHLTDRTSGGYYIYNDSLSTSPLADYTEYEDVTHVFPKLGKVRNAHKIISNLRKAWLAEKIPVAVYEDRSSGHAQYIVVGRMKQGLKEMDDDFHKSMRTTYETIHGKGAIYDLSDDTSEYIDDMWGEILFYRKDLSSK